MFRDVAEKEEQESKASRVSVSAVVAAAGSIGSAGKSDNHSDLVSSCARQQRVLITAHCALLSS